MLRVCQAALMGVGRLRPFRMVLCLLWPAALAACSGGGRPPTFDPVAYKDRNTVERAFNQLRQHRAVATRFDKRDFIWRGTIDVASIRIWLRHPAP